jgi:hypothetical protein
MSLGTWVPTSAAGHRQRTDFDVRGGYGVLHTWSSSTTRRNSQPVAKDLRMRPGTLCRIRATNRRSRTRRVRGDAYPRLTQLGGDPWRPHTVTGGVHRHEAPGNRDLGSFTRTEGTMAGPTWAKPERVASKACVVCV